MTGHLLEKEQEDITTLDHLMEGFQLIGFDWKYLYVNEAIIKQSKYSREELLGSTMMEKYPGIKDTPMFRTLEICMKERRSANFENEFVFPDESVGWFELRIQPVFEGLFILSIDITERKKAEQERKAHIKALEDMIFMTSHELRQPITNISGLLSLIEGSAGSPAELKKIITYLKISIQSLDTFSGQLTGYMHDQKRKVSEE